MAQITLKVGGRSYVMHCRDGGEDQLRTLAAAVDAKCTQASSTLGVMTEPRQLLTAAILLADDLASARKAEAKAQAKAHYTSGAFANGDASAAPVAEQNVDSARQAAAELDHLNRIAEQIETLSQALEERLGKA